MTKPPIQYIKHFEHVLLLAKTLSFTKAAQQAHLSQSAFSKSIAAFEKKIGVQVFLRTTSHVEITELGIDIIQEIQQMVFNMNNFETNVASLKQGQYGQITFGSGPYPAEIFTHDTLHNFHLQNPNINLDLRIDYWDELLRQLYNSEIDFFIADIRSLGKLEHLEIIPIGGMTLAFFCDVQHPLIKKYNTNPVNAKELLDYAFSTVSLPDLTFNDLKASLGLSSSYLFDLKFKCENLAYIASMITGSSIIGISSNYIMDKIIKNPDITRINATMKQNRFGEWALVKINNRKLSPSANKLAQMLINAIRECSLVDDKKHGLKGNKKLNFL